MLEEEDEGSWGSEWRPWADRRRMGFRAVSMVSDLAVKAKEGSWLMAGSCIPGIERICPFEVEATPEEDT